MRRQRWVYRRGRGSWRPAPPPDPSLTLFDLPALPRPVLMPANDCIRCLHPGCTWIVLPVAMLIDWRTTPQMWGDPLCDCGSLRGSPSGR